MTRPAKKLTDSPTIAAKAVPCVAIKGAKDGSPTSDQLVAINRYTMRELGEADVYCRTLVLAHNAIDRDDEVIDEALLADMARTLPGKGLFRKHPSGWDGDSGPGVGKFFAAEVRRMSFDEARRLLGEPDLKWPPAATQAEVLEASVYIARHDGNAALIADIDAGVAGYVSAGFRHSSPVGITDGENDQIMAWRLMAPGEALEGSLVWLGAQPGARVIKHVKTETEDTNMDLKQLQEKCDALEARLKGANDSIDANKAAIACFDAAKAVLGDAIADPAALRAMLAQAEDGKAFRKNLVDELISAKRLAGVLGDDAETVKAAEDYYTGMPMVLLKAEHAAAEKAKPNGGQMGGGDPNGTEGDAPKGLRDAGVTGKALDQSTGKAA